MDRAAELATTTEGASSALFSCRYSCLTWATLQMRRQLAAVAGLARMLLGESAAAPAAETASDTVAREEEPHPASVALAGGDDLLSALPAELKARPSRAGGAHGARRLFGALTHFRRLRLAAGARALLPGAC